MSRMTVVFPQNHRMNADNLHARNNYKTLNLILFRTKFGFEIFTETSAAPQMENNPVELFFMFSSYFKQEHNQFDMLRSFKKTSHDRRLKSLMKPLIYRRPRLIGLCERFAGVVRDDENSFHSLSSLCRFYQKQICCFMSEHRRQSAVPAVQPRTRTNSVQHVPSACVPL